MIYFIISGAMLFCCTIFQIANYNRIGTKKLDRVLFYFFLVVLFFLAIFRENVGLDYASYEIGFGGLHDGSGSLVSRILDNNYFEPLYNLLDIISPSFRIALILSAVLGILFKAPFFEQTNTNLFCLFLYYCSVFLYYDLGIMRQGISISIVWLSLKYIHNEKKAKYTVSVIIAALFHVTALLALPLLLIGKKRHSRKYYAALLTGSFAVAPLATVAEALIIRYAPPYISHKMLAYSTYLYTESNIRSLSTSIVVRLLFFLLFWIVFRKMGRKGVNLAEEGDWIYVNAFFLSIIETIALSSFFIVSTRGTAVLYFCYIPVFSIIVSDYKVPRATRMMSYAGVVVFVLNTLLNTLFESSGSLYLPYSIFF